ncbi:Homocysteine S-methyltransferase [Astrocystis sublimbata]|nr:Homocysteine S-methyltransferase [Astrocystis sublimbata]
MAETPIQFLDGGLGTSLEDKYNVHFTEAMPLWSSHLLLSDHDTLKSCQRDFAEVPVDILLTATYQVSVEGFQRTQTDSFPRGVSPDDIPPFIDAAVSIVEQIKRPATQIALSLGPYGAMMRPSQEYSGAYDDEHNSVDKLLRWHADRMRLFTHTPRLNSRVDFLAFETVPRLDEIVAIRKLTMMLGSESPADAVADPLGRMRYWISCVFPGTGQALPDGSSVGQVVRALLSLEHSGNPPWGIGINCTKIERLPQLVKAYEESVRLLEEKGQLQSWPSLLLYPDGTNGEVYDTASKTWKHPTGLKQIAEGSSWEEQLNDVVTKARSRGCWSSIVVGGCCKATHEDISRLRAQVTRHTSVEYALHPPTGA